MSREELRRSVREVKETVKRSYQNDHYKRKFNIESNQTILELGTISDSCPFDDQGGERQVRLN
jgi:hypothetical protein